MFFLVFWTAYSELVGEATIRMGGGLGMQGINRVPGRQHYLVIIGYYDRTIHIHNHTSAPGSSCACVVSVLVVFHVASTSLHVSHKRVKLTSCFL
jgi:hypothetical protein